MQRVWSVKRSSQRSLQQGEQMYPSEINESVDRPRTSRECDEEFDDEQGRGLGTPGNPCPFLTCRYNLLVDVNEKTGAYSINAKYTFDDEQDPIPDVELPKAAHTCSRKAAEDGPMRLVAIAKTINVTRERVRQLVEGALNKLATNDGKRHLPVAMELVDMQEKPKRTPAAGETWERLADGALVLIEEGPSSDGIYLVKRFFGGGKLYCARDKISAFMRSHQIAPRPIPPVVASKMLSATPDRFMNFKRRKDVAA